MVTETFWFLLCVGALLIRDSNSRTGHQSNACRTLAE